jgi:hypothetical protein
MSKKNNQTDVAEALPADAATEGTTTTEVVEKVTTKEEVVTLRYDQMLIKLKSGKGGNIKIQKEDWKSYEADWDKVAEGKKKK